MFSAHPCHSWSWPPIDILSYRHSWMDTRGKFPRIYSKIPVAILCRQYQRTTSIHGRKKVDGKRVRGFQVDEGWNVKDDMMAALIVQGLEIITYMSRKLFRNGNQTSSWVRLARPCTTTTGIRNKIVRRIHATTTTSLEIHFRINDDEKKGQ